MGKGIAEYLASKGYFVYVGTRNPANTSGNTKQIRLDVEDDQSIEAVVETIKNEHGKLDLLVNNAGVNKDTATDDHKERVSVLADLDRDSLLKMFSINAVSPLMISKCAAPIMGEGSFIVNVSSIRGSFQDSPSSHANYGYRSSKTALNMITRCMVMDLPSSVSVFAVHPGSVRSRMNPDGLLEPVEAAEKIYGIIENWNPKLNGMYLNNDGSLLPA